MTQASAKEDKFSEPDVLSFRAMPGHLIRRMHQSAVVIFDTEIARAGLDLTAVQFAALSAIDTRPGLDQATLAGIIAYDRVTIGGVVDRLEQKGYARREIMKTDRRSRRLFLEPAGKRVLASALPVVEAAQGLILQGLDAGETQEFLTLLEKALRAVGDLTRPPMRR